MALPKKAYFTHTGRLDHHHDPNRIGDLVELTVEQPEPCSAPTPFLQDETINPAIDESLRLSEIRHRGYVHQRRIKRLKQLSICLIILLVIFMAFLWDLFGVFNRSEIVIDSLDLSGHNLSVRGFVQFDDRWWMSYLQNSKGDWQFTDYLTVTQINGFRNRHVADFNLIGQKGKFELLGNKYLFNFENVTMDLDNGSNNFLSSIFRNETAYLRANTKLRISGLNIPAHKSFKVNKSDNIQKIYDGLLNSIDIKNLEIEDYDANQGWKGMGHFSIDKLPLPYLTLKNMEMSSLNVSIGIKSKNNILNFMNLNITDFLIDCKADNNFSFQIPNIDTSLSDLGFIQYFIDAMNNSGRIEFWLEIHSGENWARKALNGLVIPLSMDTSLISKVHFPKPNLNSTLNEFSICDNEDKLFIKTEVSGVLDKPLGLDMRLSSTGKLKILGFSFSIDEDNPLSFLLIENKYTLLYPNLVIEIEDMIEAIAALQNILTGKLQDVEIDGFLEASLNSSFVSESFRLPLKNTIGISNIFTHQNSTVELDHRVESIKVISGSPENLHMQVFLNITNPFQFKFANGIQGTSIIINYSSQEIALLTIKPFDFTSSEEFNLFQIEVKLSQDSTVGKHKLEEFIGKIISGRSSNVTIEGHSIENEKKLTNLINEVNVNLTLPSVNGTLDEFIVDSTMHLFTKEIELTVYNPFINSNLQIEITEAEASHEGTVLGYIDHKITLHIPPGIQKTDGIPIRYAEGGIGKTILNGALKNRQELSVDVRAVVGVTVERVGFPLDIFYKNTGLMSKIRL
ncbi:hypothetical protein DAMA08_000050 [Martiniozyma asiatica (nom. inval.)]|nr:hypothetical protein DAMA08_000050 [Martiniozyma asiatica]